MTLSNSPTLSLWRIRLYYFTLTAAGGFIMPFIGLFFRRQGLTGTEIGFLGTVSAVTGLIAAPLWGRQSDHALDPRRLLQIAFLGSASIHIIISQQTAFIWLAVLFFFGGILTAGIEPMSDAMTVNLIKQNQKTGFGSIRLWGSLGWAIIVVLSGWVIEKTNIISAFYGYAALMILSAVITNLLVNPTKGKVGGRNQTGQIKTRVYVSHILKDSALIGFGIAMVIIWMTRTGIFQFQAIYLDQLGARESLIGVNSMIGSVVELPAMLLADRLIKFRGSHRAMISMMILYALMNLIVVISPSIPAIIIGSAVGGIGFSFYTVGIVVFLSERAPFGQTATILAIYMTTLRGLITMLASPAAGIIFDFYGAYWLYVIGIIGSLLGLLVFVSFVRGKRSAAQPAT